MTFPIATSSRPRMLETSEVTTSGSPVPAGDDGQPDDPLGHPPEPPNSTAPVTVAWAPTTRRATPAATSPRLTSRSAREGNRPRRVP